MGKKKKGKKKPSGGTANVQQSTESHQTVDEFSEKNPQNPSSSKQTMLTHTKPSTSEPNSTSESTQSDSKKPTSNLTTELARVERIKGNTEYQKKNYTAANVAYTKAISLAPTFETTMLVELFTNRAITLLRLKDFVKVVEDCNNALVLNPNHTKAYICRGFATFYLQLEEKLTGRTRSVASKSWTYELETAQRIRRGDTIFQKNLKEAMEGLLELGKRAKKETDIEWIGDFGLLTIDETLSEPSLDTANSSANGTNTGRRADETSSSGSTVAKEEDFSDLPLLVPVGDAWQEENMPHYLERQSKRGEEMALKEKEFGNVAFSEGKFQKALLHYSNAIRLNSREAVFFSNRALVYLKMNRFSESITDCTASIDRKPSIKAFLRRAAAWASLEEYFLAAEDYKRALRIEPRNQDCLLELEKCLIHLETEFRTKLLADSKNEKLKKSLFNVREDLKRIASKIENTK